MSKIYEAYRKRAGDEPDLTAEIARIGTVGLYPVPSAAQQGEFSQLANRLLGIKREERGAVIAFASSASGEGASFVSYNAAMMLATVYQQKVAWIDANFLSPQKLLAHTDGLSLATLLQHPERLADLRPTGNPALIPGGSSLAAVRGLFADEKCQELMRALSERFDFTVIDLPPVLGTSDAALMAAATDGLTLVVEQRFLKREIIGHGMEALRAKSVRVLGAVINKRSYDLPKVIYDRL
jgi:succinoglycan biosynthesis transport protein ExoP